MLTKTHETEIRNYLLSKKLPIDLLIEVQDHFISQITELLSAENLCFNEAFNKTKHVWTDEFCVETPWYIVANRKAAAITKFEIRMRRDLQMETLKKSFLFSIIAFVLLFLAASIFRTNILLFNKYFLLVAYAFTFSIIFYNLFFNSIAYKKKIHQYKFSVNHWRTYLVFPIAYFGVDYLKPFSAWLPQLIQFQFTEQILFKATVFFCIILFLIYTGINQFYFAKTMKKVKPFIQTHLQ